MAMGIRRRRYKSGHKPGTFFSRARHVHRVPDGEQPICRRYGVQAGEGGSHEECDGAGPCGGTKRMGIP